MQRGKHPRDRLKRSSPTCPGLAFPTECLLLDIESLINGPDFLLSDEAVAQPHSLCHTVHVHRQALSVTTPGRLLLCNWRPSACSIHSRLEPQFLGSTATATRSRCKDQYGLLESRLPLVSLIGICVSHNNDVEMQH
jgi:hypothetical protein